VGHRRSTPIGVGRGRANRRTKDGDRWEGLHEREKGGERWWEGAGQVREDIKKEKEDGEGWLG